MLLAAIAAPALAEDLDLRLMTYNIYHGGQDHYPALGRQHEWLRVIESRAPDVLVIQEANGWLPSEQNLIAAYVDSLNRVVGSDPPYTGYVGDAVSLFNQALITRLPVLSFTNHRIVQVGRESCTFQHCVIHARLDADGEVVNVLGVHLRASWDQREERELEGRAILTLLAGIPAGESVWVMGDFNSYSPLDVQPGSPTPPDYEHGAPPAELVGWEPMQYLMEAGLRDSFRDRHPLDRGYTKDTVGFTPNSAGPLRRIDCLFDRLHPSWSLVQSERVTGSLANAGSDHYPILSTYHRPDLADAERLSRGAAGLRLTTASPFAAPGTIRLDLTQPGSIAAEIYAADGRAVRRLFAGDGAAGTLTWTWDGRDDRGRQMSDGVYFLSVSGAEGSVSRRLLLVRP